MYEQHERCYTLIVRAANLRGEHERLGNGENECRFCMSYRLSLALIGLAPAGCYTIHSTFFLVNWVNVRLLSPITPNR